MLNKNLCELIIPQQIFEKELVSEKVLDTEKFLESEKV